MKKQSFFAALFGYEPPRKSEQKPTVSRFCRCPNCGSPVRVQGDRWECGWCGDFGRISEK